VRGGLPRFGKGAPDDWRSAPAATAGRRMNRTRWQ